MLSPLCSAMPCHTVPSDGMYAFAFAFYCCSLIHSVLSVLLLSYPSLMYSRFVIIIILYILALLQYSTTLPLSYSTTRTLLLWRIRLCFGSCNRTRTRKIAYGL
ncbi:hypothetical protein FB451DRAFT_1261091 [Mycena latifolia]|nr:hypothetical protein FB451DRAFT_1261091 [Mycena latifolia]